MKTNFNAISSVATASVVLTFLGIFSKGIGFFREIIYAKSFGLSSEFDLFLTSVAIPIAINTAVIYLCQHYFIPAYNRLNKIKTDEKILFFNYNFWWFVFGGIIVAFILFLFSKFIFSSYMSSLPNHLQQKGTRIFLLFLITIPINAGMSVIIAYRQANFNFIYPAISLIILNSIVIILVLFFSNILRIFVLPISFVIAYIIAFIILCFSVKGKLKFISSNIFKNNFKLSDLNILTSLIFIEGFSLSYIIIDRYFIGFIPAGGIAALNYAFVIFSLPVSLFSLPLITTTFSKFSNTVLHSFDKLTIEIKNTIRVNYYIMIPCMFLLFVWGNIFLQIFYQRGQFSSNDTLITYTVLRYYSFSLIFLTTYYIFVKALYSINKYASVLFISVIAVLLKIILNSIFVEDLEQNGLALSTSMVYIILFLLGSFLLTKIKILSGIFLLGNMLYFIINGMISYVIVIYLFNLVVIDPLITELLKLPSFIMIYVLNSMFMNDYEFRIIKKSVLGIIKN